jgi:hypothetical protein
MAAGVDLWLPAPAVVSALIGLLLGIGAPKSPRQLGKGHAKEAPARFFFTQSA